MLSWENSQHFHRVTWFPHEMTSQCPAPCPHPKPNWHPKCRKLRRGPSQVWICHCIWGTSIEIAYWWHVTSTTKIWVVVLIGWSKFSANQKHYLDMGSDASSVWNLYVCSLDFIFLGNRWWRVKCWLLEASCFCSKCINGPKINYSVIFLPQF